MMLPRTRYASSGDCCIAYQVIGHGSIDLVFVPGISGLAILSNGYFGGVRHLIPDKDYLIKGGHLATSFSFGMRRG